MRIEELQQNWDAFGRIDPLWAILSVPAKANNRWDLDEFFATGVAEIQDVFKYLDSLGVDPPRKRAFELGCGVGRITQALCQYFDECDGVDIAPSMIELARKYNRYSPRCKYHVNGKDDLSAFHSERFDFVYSRLVLQHMQPAYSKRYLAEFARILRSGGIGVFQLPTLLKIKQGLSAVEMQSALPLSGFSACIEVPDIPTSFSPGARADLFVRVTNTSDSTWRSAKSIPECPIRLANHWLDADGNLLTKADGRVDLEFDLAPNETAELKLVVTTPSRPGNCVLEIDMVQEFVAWFSDRGSTPTRIPVVLNGTPDIRSSESVTPVMEMYGVPIEEVTSIITSNGGEVLDVREDPCAGVEWSSFIYCFRKQ